MAMKPKLSIIVPLRQTKATHRDVRRLDDCLHSLDNQTAKGQFEIIVSDTDSDAYYKGRHKKICQAHKGVKYFHTRTGKLWNIGRARNIGIRAARGEFIMVADMDCVFSPNFIETVLKYAADDTIIHCRLSNLPENYNGKIGRAHV